MAVRLLRQRSGGWRPTWYGECTTDGKRRAINTGVRWRGTPPESRSLLDSGDVAFERSRAEAEAVLNQFRGEARLKGNSAHLVERLIESKTGRKIEHVKIVHLPEKWAALPRAGKIDPRYRSVCVSTLKQFIEFIHDARPTATFLYELTATDVSAFSESIRPTLSAKTHTDKMKLLRTCFDRLLPHGTESPFSGVSFAEASTENGSSESIHRKPLTADELQRLLVAAKADEFLYPLVVAAVCTGLRRGDVCKLKWEAVDFTGEMLRLKTSKTGAGVEIPLFKPLRDELEALQNDGSPFVFPGAEKMLRANPDGLTWRIKKAYARAFSDDHELNAKTAIRATTRQDREQGQRSASLRDWHTLRATWVTLALAANVPIEIVRRVTGHATADIVLRHYFRPDREHFRSALCAAMPSVITGYAPEAKPETDLAALAGMIAAGTATAADRTRFKKLAAKIED